MSSLGFFKKLKFSVYSSVTFARIVLDIKLRFLRTTAFVSRPFSLTSRKKYDEEIARQSNEQSPEKEKNQTEDLKLDYKFPESTYNTILQSNDTHHIFEYKFYKEKLDSVSNNESNETTAKTPYNLSKTKTRSHFNTWESYIDNIIMSKNNEALLKVFKVLGKTLFQRYSYIEAHKFLSHSVKLVETELQQTPEYYSFLFIYSRNLQNLGFIEEAEMSLRKAMKSSLSNYRYNSFQTIECLIEYSVFFNYIEERKESYIHLRKAYKIMKKLLFRRKIASFFMRKGNFHKENIFKILTFSITYLEVLSGMMSVYPKEFSQVKTHIKDIFNEMKLNLELSASEITRQFKELLLHHEQIKGGNNSLAELLLEKDNIQLLKSILSFLTAEALILHNDGHTVKAERLYIKCIDIAKEIFGEKSEKMITYYSNTINFYLMTENEDKVKSVLEKIISLGKINYGDTHFEHGMNLLQIAKTLIVFDYKDYTLSLIRQSEVILRAFMEQVENLNENNKEIRISEVEKEQEKRITLHYYIAEINYLYGLIYSSESYEKSLTYLQSALKIYEDILGSTSESYLRTYIAIEDYKFQKREHDIKKQVFHK